MRPVLEGAFRRGALKVGFLPNALEEGGGIGQFTHVPGRFVSGLGSSQEAVRQLDQRRNGLGSRDFARLVAAADEDHSPPAGKGPVAQIEGFTQHVVGAVVEDEQEAPRQVRQFGIGDDGGVKFTHDTGEVGIDGGDGGQG